MPVYLGNCELGTEQVRELNWIAEPELSQL